MAMTSANAHGASGGGEPPAQPWLLAAAVGPGGRVEEGGAGGGTGGGTEGEGRGVGEGYETLSTMNS